MLQFLTIFIIRWLAISSAEIISFPESFKFGAASASYQVEGGWNEDGRTPSIWDTLTHSNPGFITDRSNGDVAADSYHMFDKDLEALNNIGFEVYRFSISWSRILPDGSKVNMKGIEYYSNLIDKLIASGIEPLVTIFHWDLPQYIQDLGGWTNPLVVDYYKQYVDVLFEHFGDRVTRWITFNEPSIFCGNGYGSGSHAPAIRSAGFGDYMCARNVLSAHAAAFHLYKEKYFATQGGQIGICLHTNFNYAADGVDSSFALKAMEFDLGHFANPIFSTAGGYPQIMIDEISRKSLNEGRRWSRLPEMTEQDKQYIKGTADFLALNYYTSNLVRPREDDPNIRPSWSNDKNLELFKDPSWTNFLWIYDVPEGLHDLLVYIKDTYNDPKVFITENGIGDNGQLEDIGRLNYLKGHLAAVSKALSEGCNVIGYTVWSLTDNFEWAFGYTVRFGIHSINFDSEDKQRMPKDSAKFFRDFMPTKTYEL